MGLVEVSIDAPSPTAVPPGNCLRNELKRDRDCIEVGSETCPLPAKKLVVEASSREDGRSEVSNPVVSPKEANSAFQDITSHPGHLRGTDQGGFIDETSKISYQSGSVETMCDEENVGNCTESSGKGLATPVEISSCSASRDALNHHEDNAGSYAESSDSGSPGSAKVSTSTDSEHTLSNGELGGNYTGSTYKSISGSLKGYSGLEETLSNGDNAGNYAESSGGALPGSVEKSSLVLEIPEHASTTGVRKITFRFSKLKYLDSQPAPNSTSSNVGYHKFEAGREQDNPASVGTSSEHMATYGRGDPLISNCNPIARKMELKMSKKVVPNGFPTNVKKLLSTGILDGARVKYVHSGLERGLEGIISGGGYLCGCSQCNYLKVVSAYEFELHAGVKTKHPNNHIYLDNGKPIYHIIQQVKTAPLGLLDEVIRDIAGSAINEDFFQIWKGNLQQRTSKNNAGTINRLGPPNFLQSQPKFVDNMCVESDIPMFNHSVENTVKFMGMPAKKKRAVKKSCSSTYVKQVKRSAESGRKRDNDLHKLLFMPNGLPDGAELAYSIKGQTILGGYKQGGGIVCSCCDKEISPSQFEAHAGMAARRQPYRHIYTSSGLNLHDIATSLANGQSITTGGNDDMCTVCGEGGDLILCIGCPRAFHSACLDMLSRPESDWCCSNCSDKFVPGRKMISGDSVSSRPIMIRLTRVVKEPENEIGGCAICRSHDFSVGNFDERTVMICDQCEKEFHVGCMRKAGLCDLTELPKDKWFCCEECDIIHVELQRSVSVGLINVPAIALDLINSKVMDKELLLDSGLGGVQWQILNGKSRSPEHLLLLSSATGIFRECFDPIVAASGRDLIPLMVYGRNISGQEFGGMYCIVLTVKGVVVSAGLLRVFGKGVAELPLVATAREHQGKGYFQALFSCIKEDLLCKMNVEKIVLPAAEEAELMWTKKFTFQKVSEEHVKKYMREFQLTIFMGTSLLEKEVQQPMIET